MRIIGGKYRGKKLFSPETIGVRPTSDRVRESIFNIIRSRLGGILDNCSVLDVFAGTGALGLEALSNGVSDVCFIDIDTTSVTKNANLFSNEKANIKIMKSDVTKISRATKAYDILFMDAPYKQSISASTLSKLAENGWLAPDALCIVEVERTEDVILPENFEFLDERRYGIAKIIIAKFI